MKKYIILLLFITSGVNHVLAQSKVGLKYYNYEIIFNKLLLEKDTLNAIKYIDSAMKLNIPIADYFKCAYVLYEIKNYNKSYEYLKLGASHNMSYTKFLDKIEEDRPFVKVFNNDTINMYYKDIDKVLNRLSSESYQNLNLEYLLELRKLSADDQFIRKNFGQNTKDTIILKYKQIWMQKVDSLNFENLYTLYLKHGPPYISKISDDGFMYFMIVLGHNLTSKNQTINSRATNLMHEIKKMIFEGEAHNGIYSTMFDRMCHDKYNANYYGSFYRKELPMFNYNEVDNYRTEIGLSPIKEKLITSKVLK
jgi:hypothetical protein